MAKQLKFDLCVIGAGSAGLSVAAGAQQMGAPTVLIERGEMGGDCLNYGCVPSKSLIAAAKHAHAMRASAAFGIAPVEPQVDYGRVHDHIHEVIDTIAPIDSQERFEKLGVKVIRSQARFLKPDLVEAGDFHIKARRFVVATGSSPFVPDIPGLDTVPYLTNETLFDNKHCPRHLIILGGGPIGMEMAQAHRRLGAEVTVIEMNRILSKDDPDLSDVVRRQLIAEGVTLRENSQAIRVGKGQEGVEVTVRRNNPNGIDDPDADNDGEEIVSGSHLLVAVGRRPNVADLNLNAGEIDYTERGIKVDAGLRSISNKRVFAIGDVAGQLQFTHVAGYHAGILIRKALFRVPAKSDLGAAPWVTYTDPEVAQVGLTEAAARDQYGDKVRVLHWSLEENDRAQTERRTEGFIKAMVKPNGKILGASIVAPHAGEYIQMWALALEQKMKVSALATFISPYPTYGEINKRAAGSFYTPTLYSARTRALVKFLSIFG